MNDSIVRSTTTENTPFSLYNLDHTCNNADTSILSTDFYKNNLTPDLMIKYISMKNNMFKQRV